MRDFGHIQFKWDTKKSRTNLAKHGVSFREAESVFLDSAARLIFDPDHSATEDRYILLGLSATLRVLVVCHCYHEADDVIRIISARSATKQERDMYQELLV